MPPLLLAMILATVVHHVHGNQRIVHVSGLISDEDFFTNGEDDNSDVCCVYGNCTCNSLDRALANLTSNVLINITTGMMLSSLVKVSDLQNVSIVGHSNPTVNCKHVGGIHFTFCLNCIIQSITWDGCGTQITNNLAEPGIKLSISSNVTIQNCCFQHSIGQALLLSEVSGDVSINNCNFVNNSHYRGHGAAIHYSHMNNTKKFPNDRFAFTISNCYFIDNKYIKNLVYIDNRLFNYHKIIFNNAVFISNQGICVYVINHKIYVNGNAMFKNNIAGNGTVIFISNHSRVIFDENSNVTFSHNLADGRGGAVFLTNHSICLFDQTSIVTFYYNKATKGGAIYSEDHSNVTFKAKCKVIFNSNSATLDGATICSFGNSHVVFAGISRTKFDSSVVPYHKNLVNESIRISFEENFNIVFLYNTADYGGAIYCEHYCHIAII